MSSAEIFTILAAFLSGAGSVLTGFMAIRWERRRGQEDCQKRVDALLKGIEIGKGE